MSITRNRELSQFGSFIHIDDSSKDIGITTESTPYVGIGTTNPTVKFHVVGDTNLEGTVVVNTIEASSYTLNGSPLVEASIAQWNYGTGDDIYRLDGSVSIGTSIVTEKLTVLGNISGGQFISTVTSGTAPLVVLSDTQVTNLNASFLRGKTPPSGDIVGNTDSQILSNKTLTSPTINSPSITSPSITSGGLNISGSTSGNTLLQSSSIASGTLTLPATTDTLVAKNTTDTFTNKTIAAGSNIITGLTNSNLSGSAGITNANLANSTISGISLGSNLNSLTFSSYLTSTGTYNGSTARTVSVAGTSLNTANTLVARDISGDFSAGAINASIFNATSANPFRVNGTTVIDNTRSLVSVVNGDFSGTITASTFNATSANPFRVNGTTVIDNTRSLVSVVNGDFSGNLNVSGVSTFSGITTVTGATLFTKQLNVSGVSTFNSSIKPVSITDKDDEIGSSNQVLTSTGSQLDWKNVNDLVSGRMVQFVRQTYSTITTHSTSWQPTGLSTSITPSSTDSKILIVVNQPVLNISNNSGSIRVLRESTVLYQSGTHSYGAYSSVLSVAYANQVASIFYIDSPSTTSSITYSTEGLSGDTSSQFFSNASYNDGVGNITATSQIYLIEIS